MGQGIPDTAARNSGRRILLLFPLLAASLAIVLLILGRPAPPSASSRSTAAQVAHRVAPGEAPKPTPPSSEAAPLKASVAAAPAADPASSSVAGPFWAEAPPPEVKKSFEKGRREYLERMDRELSLDAAQSLALRELYQRREEEVDAARIDSRAGTLGMEAYFDRVHAANERFYDATEVRLGTDQRVLLKRYREQSRGGVETLRTQARKKMSGS